MSRLPISLTVTLFATLLAAAPANACSCAHEDLRTQLRRVDAAFVGKLVSVKKLGRDEGYSGQPAVFVFKLQHRVKGRLGRRVHVHSNMSSASCGFELRRGDRAGLLLERRNHRWESGLCYETSPRALLRAARGARAAGGCA